jgi:hypothetical protein
MQYLIGTIALDISRERQLKGERYARLFPSGGSRSHGRSRHALARLAAGVSVAAAEVARRLDDHVTLADARRSSPTS